MRNSVIMAAVSAALCPVAANAQTIVQSFSGSFRNPNSLVLFDSSLGVLNSVEIGGSLDYSEAIVREIFDDPAPAVSIPHSISSCLGTLAPPFVSLGCPTLTGNETYSAGSGFDAMFGSIELSGNLFSVLTGGDVGQFYTSGYTSVPMIPYGYGPIFPSTGEIESGPGNGEYYQVTVTYNYTPANWAVPEPSTWAMMLLGFGAIGLAMGCARRRATSSAG